MKKGRKWTQAEKDRMRAIMLKKNGKTLVPIADVLAASQAPKPTDQSKVKVATDIVSLLVSEGVVDGLVLVHVVERILRP